LGIFSKNPLKSASDFTEKLARKCTLRTGSSSRVQQVTGLTTPPENCTPGSPAMTQHHYRKIDRKSCPLAPPALIHRRIGLHLPQLSRSLSLSLSLLVGLCTWARRRKKKKEERRSKERREKADMK
jgi:hypothetical protein